MISEPSLFCPSDKRPPCRASLVKLGMAYKRAPRTRDTIRFTTTFWYLIVGSTI
jgi:hypothetical protein